MTQADLTSVLAVAERVHPDYPEDPAVFAERLALYAAGCRVLADEDRLAGYVLSHPWRRGSAPGLNTLLGHLPADPDSYYIHDLAIAPPARVGGQGAAIVAQLASHAGAAGLGVISLVAIAGSAGFWRRQGFRPVFHQRLGARLRSYDPQASYMERALGAGPGDPLR